MNARIFLLGLLCFGMAAVASADSDYQWTFGNVGSSDYQLDAVSSSDVYGGLLGATDPTLILTVGKRYEVTVTNSGTHPFEVLAKGASPSSDVALLSQGGGSGSFESDSGVDWVDNFSSSNGMVEFTVTQGLVDAMNAGSNIPGYRCGVHVSTMRGNFDITGVAQVLVPDVVNMEQSAAETALVDAGLTVGDVIEEFHPSAPEGHVTVQNPAAGRSADVGSPVDLWVSIGPQPLTVPDVVDMTQLLAERMIERAGLTVGTVTEASSDTVSEGNVISQDPAAGTEVEPGSAVDLIVSLGPNPNLEQIENPIPETIPKGSVRIELEPVIDGLVAPLGVVFAEVDSIHMYVYDQAGIVSLLIDGGLQPEPFLDVRDRLVSLGISGPDSFDERGLIGFALHPDFPEAPRVYTYTSEPIDGPADFTAQLSEGEHNHQAVIAEWTLDDMNMNAVDPATRRELLRIDQPQFNHDGGTIRFGPDGHLYIALGDGGAADDDADGHGETGNGQNLETIHGSLLRIDVDGGGTPSANGQYGIPTGALGNPFVGGRAAAVEEIYAYGLRNPFAFSFDQGTGELYLADVGQNDIEEVNIIVSGGNYGWNIKEGTFFFEPNGVDGDGFVTDTPRVDPLPPDLVDPIAQYDHDDGTAIIGGFVYRGSAIPALDGRYVTGDFGTSFGEPSGRLFYLDETDQFMEFRIGSSDRPLGLWLKGFGQDLDGEIYVCGSEALGPFGTTGGVYKIVPLDVEGGDADVNGDGGVDAVDVQLVINSVLGLDIDPLFEADVSGDGTVDAVDVQLVINGVLGL